MRRSMRSFGLVTLLLVIVLALSGCFQDSGSGGLQPTQAGQGPIIQPPVATTPVVQPTLPPVLQPTTQVPPLAWATNTPEGAISAQEALNMTATALLAGQGGMQEMPTTPVEVAQLPTMSPTPSLTPTLFGPQGPLAFTATAMIITATQEAAASQTAVATALGTYVPSPTPTATATRDPNAIPVDCTHIVRRGETAYRIARQWGVTLNQIAQANGLTNLSLLSVGQQLIIPACGTTGLTPTPGPLPTATPTPQAPPGTTVTATAVPGEARTYVIQPGDNLYRISLRFGVTMRALANANGIANINLIRAGDTLTIPNT
jgi:LysM repeat protein